MIGVEIIIALLFIIPLAGALAIPFLEERRKSAWSLGVILTLTLTILSFFLAIHTSTGGGVDVFSNTLHVDSIGSLIAFVLSLSSLIALYGSLPIVSEWKTRAGFYSLSLLMLFGVYALIYVANLLVILSAWILASIASYTIVALAKDDYSAEGATKYALMGSASSTLLFLGVALLFVISGSLSLEPISKIYASTLLATAIFLIAAIGFKMGIVPFQAWLPDTYGGVDPVLISFVSTAAKAMAIATLYRVATALAIGSPHTWLILVAVFSILTMFYGNITALVQNNAQRILAYSSIAHAGYLLIGIAAIAPIEGIVREWAIYGLLLQYMAYSLGKVGAFLTLAGVRKTRGRALLEDLRGLGRRDPVIAVAFTMLLLSLMGMPPLIGFWGKLFLFASVAFAAPWLTLIALLNTAISVAYYARIIKAVYFEAGGREGVVFHTTLRQAVIVAAILTVVFGLGLGQILLTLI